MDIKLIRTRWAAVGAAVAITLGAGGISITQATTSSGEKPIYKPINPCRLADLRPAPNTVGTRTAGLGPDETYTLDGWGTVGDCTLPTGTTGLALNVTAVDPTAPTFLRLWPADGTQPTTSNLNPAPGQPPTPNAVNVGLSATTGEFSIFNRFGIVNVIIDVVGVYDDHNHDDRYYQKSEVDAAVGAKANSTDVYTKSEVDALVAPFTNSVAAHAIGPSLTDISTNEVLTTVALAVPADGVVVVNSSAYIFNSSAGAARCSITENTTVESAFLQYAEHAANDGATIAGTRGYDVTAGETLTVNLVCNEFTGDTTIRIPSLTAIFAPS